MSKLEQKLIELGYEQSNIPKIYVKRIYCNNIQMNVWRNTIVKPKIQTNNIVETQQDIDNLQQAFDTMQRHLEARNNENK